VHTTSTPAAGGLLEEHQAAAEFAAAAGELLLALRDQATDEDRGDLGDRRAHELLMELIRARFPQDQIRSEEGDALDPDGGRLWVIDPLDGTREYREGRSDWAVHVALAVGGRAVVGAVALPGLGEVLSTGAPPAMAPAATPPRIVISRTRPPSFVPALTEALGATTVPMGSAGAKIAAVIRGEAEVYVHAGGQYEWDSAAPVAVAQAAGLHTSRVDGSELVYGSSSPWLPDLVVCRPQLAAPTLATLATLGLEPAAAPR
jgi:3'(2'), 5'-bisphosphate nucleotidase